MLHPQHTHQTLTGHRKAIARADGKGQMTIEWRSQGCDKAGDGKEKIEKDQKKQIAGDEKTMSVSWNGYWNSDWNSDWNGDWNSDLH